MTRQVVSYSDLDVPCSTSNSLSTEPVTHSSNSSERPSPPKKRKREEVNGENSSHKNPNIPQQVHFEKVETMNMDTGKDGIRVPSSSSPSQISLPPKPPVIKKQKRGRKNWRSKQENNPVMKGGSDAHWDDPGAQFSGISYDDAAVDIDENNGDEGWEGDGYCGTDAIAAEVDEEGDEDDESRDLSHEEIWDDSALIEAWDAANEEYEAIHGKNKRWKKDRIHKSPLWYNIPPEKPSKKSKGKGKVKEVSSGFEPAATPNARIPSEVVEDNQSSVPHNFDTFVPTHDPSLTFTNPPSPLPIPENAQAHLLQVQNYYESIMTPLDSNTATGSVAPVNNVIHSGVGAIKADDAFNRAIGAMYWCGYWTAVYHVQRAHEQSVIKDKFTAESDDTSPIQEEETEELVSTQR